MRYGISLLLLLSSFLRADDFALKELFSLHDVQGTIVIESLDGKQRYIHNTQRAQLPLLPASTFKIPHTLIALNEGLVKNEESPIVWDGKKRSMELWNRNQTLQSAFAVSCVWCYQQFAQKISKQKYEHYLEQLHYGNAKTGKDIQRFWLDGKLRITALEQVAFLKRLYNNELPFKPKYIQTLKNIMHLQSNSVYDLYAKTSWAITKEPHGWFVGYLQTNNQVWFFATNIKVAQQSALPLRKKITLEAFKVIGVL